MALMQSWKHTKREKIKNYRNYTTGQIFYLIYKCKRIKLFGYVWRADGQVMKEVLDNKINKKLPTGRLRT